jgi:hypothetical protein
LLVLLYARTAKLRCPSMKRQTISISLKKFQNINQHVNDSSKLTNLFFHI